MKVKLFKFFIFILGIFMLMIFLYFRFIKERIPRDIPFNLTTLKLLFLIYLCLILILNKYIIYSLKKTKEELTKSLESYLTEARISVPMIDDLVNIEQEDSSKNDPDYDEDSWYYIREVAGKINVQFSNFLQYQTINNKVKLDYSASYEDTFIKYFAKKNNLIFRKSIEKDYENELDAMIKNKIEDVLQIALIEYYYNLTVYNNKLVKLTFLLIYMIYFICWLYILLVSLYTYDFDYEKILKIAIQINYTWTYIENPFLF
jgi:hypothetical protein